MNSDHPKKARAPNLPLQTNTTSTLRKRGEQSRVVISNGFHRFHLAHLAAALRDREWDVELLTGLYPTPTTKALLNLFVSHRSALRDRLIDREVSISNDNVYSDSLSEIVQKLGHRFQFTRLGKAAERAGYQSAAIRAAARLRRTRHIDLYHFRSAFGLRSLETALDLGIPTICDHSTVHPTTVEPLLAHNGRIPSEWMPGHPDGVWQLMLNDIERADWTLVNSDFVRETFEIAGSETNRVRVIRLGVDPSFINAIPPRFQRSQGSPIRLLFAGHISRPKGADTIFRALSALEDLEWTLDLAGALAPTILADWPETLTDPRVTYHGVLRRRELAVLMSQADIFVLPSLVEGSARVIPEAMAAGCYIITTPNSGSIVEDGVHGRLIPTGDHRALALAIQQAAEDPIAVEAIGRENAGTIQREYLARHYAERVEAFYREIL